MKIEKIKNNCLRQDSNFQPDASLQKVYLHPNLQLLVPLANTWDETSI